MKRGLRNGVAPYIPAAFCRDAGSAGHGATEAARPERSLQARGFASGMEARQGGDSFAGSVHDSPPRQGDARKRHKQENNKTDVSGSPEPLTRGEQLFQFEPREIRRIFVCEYEIRYELTGQTIYVLRLWHTRENR